MSTAWWLDPIPDGLRDEAVSAIEAGNVTRFLCYASNDFGLMLVACNYCELKRLGLYERALLDAFISARVNHRRFGLTNVRHLLELADRKLLRQAGHSLPGTGPFTVYRGIAGNGRARQVHGFSWTASFERAKWFAQRFRLPKPAVYRAVVNDFDVLAYSNERNESEFIVVLPESYKPKRVWCSDGVSESKQSRSDD